MQEKKIKNGLGSYAIPTPIFYSSISALVGMRDLIHKIVKGASALAKPFTIEKKKYNGKGGIESHKASFNVP